MLQEATLFGIEDKEEIAIMRIQEFQNRDDKKKNVIGFSGGKDSLVLKHLCKRAGIKGDYVYSQTSVDPPELIYYIREHHKDIRIAPYRRDKETGQAVTMWTLIPKKGFLPTGRKRYCCDELKERTGDDGDTLYLGVRWAESAKRSNQQMVGFWKKKIAIRPIIDWSDDEVWEYIRKYKLPYCSLYDGNWKRVGCVGCPCNTTSARRELEEYPKIRANYIRAIDKMLIKRRKEGKPNSFETAEETMSWWLREIEAEESPDEWQCSLWGEG